jgi:alpha-galactosidase
MYHWDFGDGVTSEGREVNHTYTEPGDYSVHLTASGLSGIDAEDHFELHISGHMPTTFDPANIRRYQPTN